MHSIIEVSPFRCRVWHLHDRLQEHITEESCRAEIESFKEHGQLVPVLGRRALTDDDQDIELIYGARRLFAARLVNRPLLVELRDLSDREAIIAMDIENRQRLDISPYERGMSYARWLRAGHFSSQLELARAMKISASQVSRLLKLAKLPSVVVNAFGSALDICEGWGVELADALEDPSTRSAAIKIARQIGASNPRPAATEVYRRVLSSAAKGRTPSRQAHDKVVKDRNGAPLFRVRFQRTAISLMLPIESVSSKTLQAIEAAVAGILNPGMPEPRFRFGTMATNRPPKMDKATHDELHDGIA